MKTVIMIILVAACMAFMGFMRTRKLVKDAEQLRKGEDDDSKSTGGAGE